MPTLLHSHQVSLDEGDNDIYSSQRDLELLATRRPTAADWLRSVALVQHVGLGDWSASVIDVGCDHLQVPAWQTVKDVILKVVVGPGNP